MDAEATPWAGRHQTRIERGYLETLGLFVHRFAAAETMLYRLLVIQTGLDSGPAAAILSGLRMKPAMDALNRLFETEGRTDEKDALAPAFKQLGDISSIRDDILHHGTLSDEFGELYVSNVHRKHLAQKATTRRVTTDDLFYMSIDLEVIEAFFVCSMIRTLGSPSDYVREHYERCASDPWLYKSRAPIPLPDKIPWPHRA